MKTNKLFIVLILVLIVFSFYLFSLKEKENNLISKACFEQACFYLEVADTPELRSRGLMFQEELAENQAMLFVFPEPGIYKFWMKNTLIPLDIVWLDPEKEVIFIEHNAEPCFEEECPFFGPQIESKYVLEIKGGLAEKINIEIGDKVNID